MKIDELFSVKGKVALVTGGSRGIGLMIARTYVENGVKTYIASRKAEVCESVAKDLSAHGECIGIGADLSTMEGVQALADELGKREEKLDILVNNAGAAWGAAIEEFPESGWDKVMDLNVKSVFFLTQKLIPMLRKSATAADPARVIIIGSIDGLMLPIGDHTSYKVSKAAVHHLTRELADKLAPNITVNAVAPGPFESKMMEHNLENFGDEIVARNPRKRIGVPADMQGVAIYLASKAGAFVNAAIIPVDGGVSGTVGSL